MNDRDYELVLRTLNASDAQSDTPNAFSRFIEKCQAVERLAKEATLPRNYAGVAGGMAWAMKDMRWSAAAEGYAIGLPNETLARLICVAAREGNGSYASGADALRESYKQAKVALRDSNA